MRIKQWKIEKVTSFTHFTQKNIHISVCISLYISKSATITIACSFLFFFNIIFLPSHSLSSLDSLSPQPIISTTNQRNLAPPTTHRPTTANHTQTHHRNLTPPTTTTTTWTHHKINQKSNKPTNKHTTKSTKNQTIPHTNTPTKELVVVGWCMEVDWNKSRCLWRRLEILGCLEWISMDQCL